MIIRMGMTRKDSKETHPCSISLTLQATVAPLCVKSSRHDARLVGWLEIMAATSTIDIIILFAPKDDIGFDWLHWFWRGRQ
jgi:hypothetical protein